MQPTWLEMHKRAAVALGDVDGLDLRRPSFVAALGKPQQPLARAVDGDLLRDDFRPVERVGLFEVAARRSLETSVISSKRGDAAHVYPAPELGGAHVELLCRNARSGERRLNWSRVKPASEGFAAIAPGLVSSIEQRSLLPQGLWAFRRLPM